LSNVHLLPLLHVLFQITVLFQYLFVLGLDLGKHILSP
jgi:hypothetical protein